MRNSAAISMLLLAAAAGWAEGAASCRCGAFITTEEGDILIYALPTTDVETCDDVNECSRACVEEVGDGGDLFGISSDGERTNGQVLCDELAKPIENQYIYGYYEICGGPWEYTDVHSGDMLCCDDSGQQQVCIA
ncbi:unnamed protein product [Meganyctiphanes norvegica]|uniref:Uncharacterized protein n=1 Tax=Meganyctiphanes norvegica TaxID=48144 RepID=A0AAV2R329_MEGNR